MYQVVAFNHLPALIRQQRKSVTGRLGELAGRFRLVNADCDCINPRLMKRIEVLLNAPQLGVTDWSPVASIKNQQDTLCRLVVDRLCKQVAERDRFVVNVRD